MSTWICRRDASMPYQEWRAFPPDAIVQVRSMYWPDVPDAIGPARSFWWGHGEEFGHTAEGVIWKARRLDRPKQEPQG